MINKIEEQVKPLTKLEQLKVQSDSVASINLDSFTKEQLLEKFKYKKIVVAGPPRSGKSCFNTGLKDILKIENVKHGTPYPFVFTACPDGEGAWFQETMNNNPELAAQIKKEYKGKFTPEFVQLKAESVDKLGNDSSPLNFIDIGGIITPENAQIIRSANAGIILCGDGGIEGGMVAEWKKFFTDLGIPVVAEIYSDYNGVEDVSEGTDTHGVYRGSVHHLERGEKLIARKTLQDLAQHLLVFEEKYGKEHFYEIPSPYTPGLLDPRPGETSEASNEMLFAKATNDVLGVEMTLPKYLEKCTLGNIDPQHSEGDITRAAIDDAVNFPLPPKGAMFVTVRPDLDAFGAMAVLSLRQKGAEINDEILSRIHRVSQSDIFANGDWEPRSLPTVGHPDHGIKNSELAAVAAEISDFKKSSGDRLKAMEQWLETGKEDIAYRQQVINNNLEIAKALESGAITHRLSDDGKIAIVNSTHRGGVEIGYCLAPMVIATNPQFSMGGSAPFVKHTVCQYKLGYIDMPAVLAELKQIEEGWGGSPTIIGSPQGVSSRISQDELLQIVERHLTKNKES